MQNVSTLRVFDEAEEIALEIYRLTRVLPDEERFVLGQQMRRAAVSIGSNIAEGCGRVSGREFARFLDTALGSANELEFQLRLVRRLAYAPEHECTRIARRVVSVERMLTRLILRIRPAPGTSRGRP
jgi:four helix bundle protein